MKAIDGKDFLRDGFGVCINHNTETGEYAPVEDCEGQNLYYVDNLGDKHWFDKVDRTIDRVDNLEKAVEECRGQQEKTTGQEMSAIGDCVVAEPQREYGAELFEQYQREHGAELAVKAAG